ncbi:hypothetical protein, partial [Polaromonas sp. UBA4122]|uniref:hypothetical protein n=1 Tax=Polaromonas sp. UBA4122 TaxID=1947074 RepID=UPI0025CD4DFB
IIYGSVLNQLVTERRGLRLSVGLSRNVFGCKQSCAPRRFDFTKQKSRLTTAFCFACSAPYKTADCIFTEMQSGRFA